MGIDFFLFIVMISVSKALKMYVRCKDEKGRRMYGFYYNW